MQYSDFHSNLRVATSDWIIKQRAIPDTIIVPIGVQAYISHLRCTLFEFFCSPPGRRFHLSNQRENFKFELSPYLNLGTTSKKSKPKCAH